MKITITIDMGNAAFEESRAAEVARMLRELATKLDRDDGLQEMCWHGGKHRLRDINGNTCGKVFVG